MANHITVSSFTFLRKDLTKPVVLPTLAKFFIERHNYKYEDVDALDLVVEEDDEYGYPFLVPVLYTVATYLDVKCENAVDLVHLFSSPQAHEKLGSILAQELDQYLKSFDFSSEEILYKRVHLPNIFCCFMKDPTYNLGGFILELAWYSEPSEHGDGGGRAILYTPQFKKDICTRSVYRYKNVTQEPDELVKLCVREIQTFSEGFSDKSLRQSFLEKVIRNLTSEIKNG